MRTFKWILLVLFALMVWFASCGELRGATRTTQQQKKHAALVMRLKKAFFDTVYVEKILSDPRCTFDSTIYTIHRKSSYTSFLDSPSVARGVAFWKSEKGFLDSLQKKYGPPPDVVVAIFRFESDLGTFWGDHKVFPTLYTLYFHARTERKKTDWFRQMVCFLDLARENKWDPFEIPSSWAGAFGLSQFMPCSYAYAVDGDANDTINLFDTKDALASSANFLARHGWGMKSSTHTRALYAYNKGSYWRAILQYAERMRKKF